MPFKKTGKNTYKSPSWKTMKLKQVRAYYATKRLLDTGDTKKPWKAKK